MSFRSKGKQITVNTFSTEEIVFRFLWIYARPGGYIHKKHWGEHVFYSGCWLSDLKHVSFTMVSQPLAWHEAPRAERDGQDDEEEEPTRKDELNSSFPDDSDSEAFQYDLFAPFPKGFQFWGFPIGSLCDASHRIPTVRLSNGISSQRFPKDSDCEAPQ